MKRFCAWAKYQFPNPNLKLFLLIFFFIASEFDFGSCFFFKDIFIFFFHQIKRKQKIASCVRKKNSGKELKFFKKCAKQIIVKKKEKLIKINKIDSLEISPCFFSVYFRLISKIKWWG